MTTLTAHAVYAAALSVVDHQGPDKLTMRAVATALGVEAPSLYHHVPNKSGLVDGIVVALVEEVAVPRPGKGREATVLGWARAWRKVLDRHPQAVRLVGARPSLALSLLDRSGTTLAELEAGGMPADGARDLLRTALLFELGHAEVVHAGVPVEGAAAWHDAALRALVTGFGSQVGSQVGAAAEQGTDASGVHADEGAQDEAPPVEEAGGDVEGGLDEGAELAAADHEGATEDAEASEAEAEASEAEAEASEAEAGESEASTEAPAAEAEAHEASAEAEASEAEAEAHEAAAPPPAEAPRSRPVAAAPPPRPTPQIRPEPEPPRRGLRGRLRSLLNRDE